MYCVKALHVFFLIAKAKLQLSAVFVTTNLAGKLEHFVYAYTYEHIQFAQKLGQQKQ